LYRVYNKDIVNLIKTLSKLFNTNPYFPQFNHRTFTPFDRI